jgi:hypothetical protein
MAVSPISPRMRMLFVRSQITSADLEGNLALALAK